MLLLWQVDFSRIIILFAYKLINLSDITVRRICKNVHNSSASRKNDVLINSKKPHQVGDCCNLLTYRPRCFWQDPLSIVSMSKYCSNEQDVEK